MPAPSLNPRRRRLLALAVTMAIGAAGCSGSSRSTATRATTTTVTRDCPTPAVSISIGNPILGNMPSEFTTDGSPIYITTDFQRPSGWMPGSYTTAVFVGHIDAPPAYDAARWHVTNAKQEIYVEYGQLSVLHLEPGRYWLVESNGLLLTADGCTTGAVTDVKIAPQRDPATGRIPG